MPRPRRVPGFGRSVGRSAVASVGPSPVRVGRSGSVRRSARSAACGLPNTFGLNSDYDRVFEWFVFVHYLTKLLDWFDTLWILMKKIRHLSSKCSDDIEVVRMRQQ